MKDESPFDCSIPVAPDQYTIVSPEDYEYLSQFKWHLAFGYAARWETGKGHRNRKMILMHRLIMNPPAGMVTDHINGNKIDNRRQNLRNCTQSHNRMNQRANRANKTSIYKGVNWHKKNKAWRALITLNGKQIELGRFKNEQHAALCYDLWAREIYGQYAYLNYQGAVI